MHASVTIPALFSVLSTFTIGHVLQFLPYTVPHYLCLSFTISYLLQFSKCQSQWHVTMSTSYIKWTAFLITVVAHIPLRQSYLDYN